MIIHAHYTQQAIYGEMGRWGGGVGRWISIIPPPPPPDRSLSSLPTHLWYGVYSLGFEFQFHNGHLGSSGLQP